MADDIDTRLADWESRLDRLDGNDENVAPSEANGNHLLFVPAPSGYRLVERTGSAPAAGDVLDEGEGRYVVSRVIRSPLPGDTRPCAYVALI